MRRAILLALIILLTLPLASATDITENTDESSNGTLDGDYTVKDGATWTISGHYIIEEGTSITVEDGATMVVSGSMNASATPQLNLEGTANVLVPIGNLGESGLMRIYFAEEVLYGIDIEINGNTTENWTGTQYDWTGDMDVENITVNITTNPFQVSSISSITLSPDGVTPVSRSPEELSGTGTSIVIPDRNNAWNIDVQGTLIITGSIFGAGIVCHGTCTLNGAQMTSTGPIEVFGSISVTDSSLSGGITDEDIIVWDDAGIEWVNSVGTGGDIDNWVNILTTRTIGVKNGYIVFYGYDMGYNSIDTSPLSDNSTFSPENMGDNTIEIAPNERARMVRWQDGNGVLTEESASGKLVLSTPWGDYEEDIADLPKVNHFDVDLTLPKLNFDSLIASDDENDVDMRLGVDATVSNSGNAPANFLIDCVSNGVDADVGVTVYHSIDAGETKNIAMNWASAKEGDLTLECTIFVPYHFEGHEVVTSGTAESGIVTWEFSESSENLVVPIAIGIVLAVMAYVGFVVYTQKKKSQAAAIEEKISRNFDDSEVGTIE